MPYDLAPFHHSIPFDCAGSDYGAYDEILDAGVAGDAARLRELGDVYAAAIRCPASRGGSPCPNVAAALLELCRYLYATMPPERKISPVDARSEPEVTYGTLDQESRDAARKAFSTQGV